MVPMAPSRIRMRWFRRVSSSAVLSVILLISCSRNEKPVQLPPSGFPSTAALAAFGERPQARVKSALWSEVKGWRADCQPADSPTAWAADNAYLGFQRREDELLVLVAFEGDRQRVFVADAGYSGLHAEIGALELTGRVAAASLLVVSRRRVALEAQDRQRERLGDAEEGQFAIDRRRVVAGEVHLCRLEGHL